MKVYDAVRYSDPMSNDALSGVESQITIQISSLAERVASDDAELERSVAAEMLIFNKQQNKKCKLLKQGGARNGGIQMQNMRRCA